MMKMKENKNCMNISIKIMKFMDIQVKIKPQEQAIYKVLQDL